MLNAPVDFEKFPVRWESVSFSDVFQVVSLSCSACADPRVTAGIAGAGRLK
jgi:hypothetical protein